MVSIAARARPTVAGALLVTGIAVVPWADSHLHKSAEAPVTHDAERFAVGRVADSIILTPWDRVELAPQHFEILVPPAHPDAQDWPRGMVIGRHMPSVDPGILQWFGSPFANVMSVLIAPWQALAHQLGT